ncbi:MAG: hypothetical protein RLZZ623_859 [Actinomycetota bacterium]|jgi:hypothetical protein
MRRLAAFVGTATGSTNAKRRLIAIGMAAAILTAGFVPGVASAAFTNGCISGTACFRKSTAPATEIYTSSSDSNWSNDYAGTAPVNQYRQRMSTYELYTYRIAGYVELDMCASPEGSAAPWRSLPDPTGSHKVLNIDAC